MPRYTSYPTAPHFSAEVGSARYRQWLGELSPDAVLSLYLHVPFCASLCWFCGCNMRVVNRYEPVANYVETLLREIDAVTHTLAEPRPVSAIHFGGGSPSALSGRDFGRIIGRLRTRFRVADDADIAVELDPRSVSDDLVDALGAAGVTRASLGVQDFDAEVQKAINRIQPFDVTRDVVERVREAGVSRLNLDLMYGLPLQTVSGLARSARLALALAPDRVALFGYAHVPWIKRHQRLIAEADLPGAEERLEQFAAASEVFLKGGMVPIGLDHFAGQWDGLACASRAGLLRRNFQGYTDDRADALIGFGASAIGALPRGYVQNATDVRAWHRAIADGGLAVVKGLELSGEDRLRRDVIERLMCDLAVDTGALSRRHGMGEDHLAPEVETLAPLVEDGLVEVKGGSVRVTAAGRPVLRLACAAFDAYLRAGAERHARAM